MHSCVLLGAICLFLSCAFLLIPVRYGGIGHPQEYLRVGPECGIISCLRCYTVPQGHLTSPCRVYILSLPASSPHSLVSPLLTHVDGRCCATRGAEVSHACLWISTVLQLIYHSFIDSVLCRLLLRVVAAVMMACADLHWMRCGRWGWRSHVNKYWKRCARMDCTALTQMASIMKSTRASR